MSRLNIAVLVSGNGSNLQALIDAAEQGRINGQLVCVISDKKNAYALQRANKHGIAAIALDRHDYAYKIDFDAELSEQLKSRSIDLIVLAGFLSILPENITKEFEGKIINIHPSLIPAYCGKGFYGEKVHKAVIDNGEKVTGATVHFVDEGTDTGPVILQQSIAVAEGDTPETLASRVLEVEHQLIVKAVTLFCEGKIVLLGKKVNIL